jgi:two-component system cell cycle response regulator
MTTSQADRDLKVLLIEDNPDDAELILAALSEIQNFRAAVERAETLAGGLERLSQGDVQLILLDLGLPDSLGIQTFERILAHSPELPIIIMSGLADEDLAIRTVQEGAQDYLVKGNFDGRLLARSIRYAIERHKIKAELSSLSMTDDLTGLYNRRGFLTLAKQQIKIAGRLEKNLLLIYADLDNLKSINDRLGHSEGDRALQTIADILNRTFRASDLIARIGGDEFVILGIEESQADFQKMRERIQRNIDRHAGPLEHPYELAISVGILRCQPEKIENLESLLAQADQLMYEQKMLKKSKAGS